MTACIYYHPEAYSTVGPKLMGRNAAGESFLRGYLEHSGSEHYWALVQNREHAQSFREEVDKFGSSKPAHAINKSSLDSLSEIGTMFYPGPSLGQSAFERMAYGSSSWSLCGITHTTSSAGAMDSIGELLTAPVQPWDALICTSTAVKNNVTKIFQAQADYLKHRLGITRVVLPQMPVIPLGIHTQDFVFDNETRSNARMELGIDQDTIVVLYTGRLSFHAKAHPLAMYQALEIASTKSGKRVVLIECGWHANDYIAKAYDQAAEIACPSVRVITLDGRSEHNREAAWASADVFCSLSDNIQETFGIVPIEAMAAGLPVVVSDWDGYKDTVRDGVDGFRIPTLMPPSGLGGDLALRHALEIDTYDMYCGHASSLVSIDVMGTAQAFKQLFQSRDLRHKMGEAGRARAQEHYDWSKIIPRYEELWEKLHRDRHSSSSDNEQAHSKTWPTRLDPFLAFECYSSSQLLPSTVINLVDSDYQTANSRFSQYMNLDMVNFAKYVWPEKETIDRILTKAAEGPIAAIDLLDDINEREKPLVFRALVALIKLNILAAV